MENELMKRIKRLELENKALRRHLRRHDQREVPPEKLVHIGLHADRLQWGDLERAFAETWAKENVPVRGTSYGQGMLQDLMFKDRSSSFGGRDTVCMEIINQRDAEIVATVIQWLGTNCGICFLMESLKKCGISLDYSKSSSRSKPLAEHVQKAIEDRKKQIA